MKTTLKYNGIPAVRLLALGAVCLVMWACGKKDGEQPYSVPKPVAFTGVESRAIPLPDGQFGVLAYYTLTNTWNLTGAGTTPSFMYNQMVQKSGNLCTYSPLSFWPGLPNEKISFYAYSPYNAEGIVLSDSTQTGVPWIDYTVPGAASLQSDLLYAATLDKIDDDAPVMLLFAHALTQIKVSAKVIADNSQYTATMTGCKISGANDKGRLSLGSGTWSALSGSAAFTLLDVAVPGDSIPIPYNTLSPNVALGRMMLIPQTVNGQIELAYTIRSPFDDVPIYRTDTIPLSSVVWDRNKIINYLLTIKLTGVDFTLQVENWTERNDPNSGTALE